MAWDGYISLEGTEILNVERTEAYAEDLRWFRALYDNHHLHAVLGDDPYTDPATDTAPWYDPAVPWSAEFYGVYPLEVAGLDDSTAAVTASESTVEGGTITGLRRSTRSAVFSVMLVGASDAGVEYGRQWLTKALRGLCGSRSTPDGLTLTYLASEPSVGDWDGPGACSGVRYPRPNDPFAVEMQLSRSQRRVGVTAPLVTGAKRNLSDGGAAWNVTFTLTAGNPHEYGYAQPLLEHWLHPDDPTPWAAGTAPAGASISGPVTIDEVACPAPVYAPVYDPLCPSIVAPPNPPGIEWGCYEAPDEWDRYTVVIPATLVPGWTEAVMVTSITPELDEEARNVRIRLYADPLATGELPEDECAYAADFVVTYVPAGTVVTLDGVDQMVWVVDEDGLRRRADTLVYGSDGSFFEWPALTCGQQYLMTLDLDTAHATPSIDVTLVERLG
jgi:hypothetical protein